MTTKLYFLLIILFATSCVSEKELLNYIEPQNIKNNVEINNNYSNVNLNNNSYQNLNEIFEYQNKFSVFSKYNKNKLGDSVIVNIVYNGRDSLNVSYLDSNEIINFQLKVINKGKYLTFKRKFKLIPIPFLFCYYWNEKTIIYIDNDDNLNFLSGQNQFIWIFIAGGDRKIYENKFEIQK
ncbi:MAG: hypothetical protein RLZ33_2407 [Bacteroidota bacterium]